MNGTALQPLCSATTRAGDPCKKTAMIGLTICRFHGGTSPHNREKNQRTKLHMELETRMRRLVTPIAADDPEARGDAALVMELRRTVARVRVLDEWIMELTDESLGWSKTAEERERELIDAGTWGKTTRKKIVLTHEQKMNVYVEWQMKERQHLAQLAKIWIASGFKARELDIQETQVLAFNHALLELCSALGHDPASPAVAQAIYRATLGLAQKAIEA